MNFLKRLLLAAIRIGIGVLALAATYSAWSGQTPTRLLYFTTESNIGIGIVFIWAGLAALLKGVEPPAWLKGALTLYILITGIVGTFILPVPNLATEPVIFGVLARTFVVHRVVPLLALADFVLFDVHRRYKWHYAFSWLSWPLFFLLLILAHAHFMPAQGISGLRPAAWHYFLPAFGGHREPQVGRCIGGGLSDFLGGRGKRHQLLVGQRDAARGVQQVV